MSQPVPSALLGERFARAKSGSWLIDPKRRTYAEFLAGCKLDLVELLGYPNL
jgi:hypothetical protein